jgi:hypothetical protein
MTTFEYITVLVSIIVGLGITHLLIGIARLINRPDQNKVYWIHLLWVIQSFEWLVYFWWFNLTMGTWEEWTGLLYTFFILWVVVSFLRCAVIIPIDLPESGDFRDYFYAKRAWFFGLLLVEQLFNLLYSVIRDFTPPLWIWILSLGPFAVAMVTRNSKYHAAFAILWVVLLTLWLALGTVGGQVMHTF